MCEVRSMNGKIPHRVFGEAVDYKTKSIMTFYRKMFYLMQI